MVTVTYRLVLGKSISLFERKYEKFDPKTDLQPEVYRLLTSTNILAFNNLLTNTWTAIPTEYIKQRGQIQIAKIQDGD